MRRGCHRFVPVLPQVVHDLAAYEAGAADDHDLHGGSPFMSGTFSTSRTARHEFDRETPGSVTGGTGRGAARA